jgi:hypothetical protein
MQNNKTLFTLGVQILMHIFRIVCIRSGDIKEAILKTREAEAFFFEYIRQMNEQKMAIDNHKMTAFIYDKIIEPRHAGLEASISTETKQDLDWLPQIFAILPECRRSITLTQLQELWLILESKTESVGYTSCYAEQQI